jgi:demethylmacrocin O-methyltransferase
MLKIKNTEIFCGSQSDEKILSKIVNKYKKFDIIIDDGSHVNKDVIKTFNFLFPFLSENGLYFIEDIQTSYMPNWGGDGVNFNNKKTHYFIAGCLSMPYRRHYIYIKFI